jgi:hypothetical protein
MRGYFLPITPRSSAAIAPPKRTPAVTVERLGRTSDAKIAQPSDNAICTGTAATASTGRRVSFGKRIEPAATVGSLTWLAANPETVEGIALSTAAKPPAANPSFIRSIVELGAAARPVGRGGKQLGITPIRQRLLERERRTDRTLRSPRQLEAASTNLHHQRRRIPSLLRPVGLTLRKRCDFLRALGKGGVVEPRHRIDHVGGLGGVSLRRSLEKPFGYRKLPGLQEFRESFCERTTTSCGRATLWFRLRRLLFCLLGSRHGLRMSRPPPRAKTGYLANSSCESHCGGGGRTQASDVA